MTPELYCFFVFVLFFYSSSQHSVLPKKDGKKNQEKKVYLGAMTNEHRYFFMCLIEDASFHIGRKSACTAASIVQLITSFKKLLPYLLQL